MRQAAPGSEARTWPHCAAAPLLQCATFLCAPRPLQFRFNITSSEMGTRRPLIVQMVHDPSALEPRCRLQDEDSDEYGQVRGCSRGGVPLREALSTLQLPAAGQTSRPFCAARCTFHPVHSGQVACCIPYAAGHPRGRHCRGDSGAHRGAPAQAGSHRQQQGAPVAGRLVEGRAAAWGTAAACRHACAQTVCSIHFPASALQPIVMRAEFAYAPNLTIVDTPGFILKARGAGSWEGLLGFDKPRACLPLGLQGSVCHVRFRSPSRLLTGMPCPAAPSSPGTQGRGGHHARRHHGHGQGAVRVSGGRVLRGWQVMSMLRNALANPVGQSRPAAGPCGPPCV